ncbi:MAG TPA: sigma-70 family RNA polymerase sigma factor [Kofleriaceae bacterium]|nr:sigma-70 family RNA polymerase sigma factor [Kofleriaceae bacterium]
MPRTADASTAVPTRSELRRTTPRAPRTARVSSADRRAAAAHSAFAAECLPLAGELQGTALRLTRNPDDARDLVQETLMRAMVAWSRFAPGSNVRAWLYRILTNSFINGYRKRRRHQRFAAERPGDARMAVYGTADDHTGDPTTAMTEDLLSDEVRAALDRLGPDYREVVQRADLAGERYKDIADALDVPIGTVMSRLFRARRQLEADLEGYAARDWGLRKAA